MTRSAFTTGRMRLHVFWASFLFLLFFDLAHLFLTLTTTTKTSHRPEMSLFLTVSLNGLNKQEYQQSASRHCLFECCYCGFHVSKSDRKLLFQDTVDWTFLLVCLFFVVRVSCRRRLQIFHTLCCWNLWCSPWHCVCVWMKERGQSRTTLLRNAVALPNYPSVVTAAPSNILIMLWSSVTWVALSTSREGFGTHAWVFTSRWEQKWHHLSAHWREAPAGRRSCKNA